MNDEALDYDDDAEDYDAEAFIDRAAERELFGELVKCQDTRRLLTICDDSDHGKSALLRRLEYMCTWEMNPPVAVGRVVVDELEFPTPHAVVSRAARGIRKAGCKPSRFEQVEADRIKRRQTVIEMSGQVNAGLVEGGTQIGTQINAPVTVVAGEVDREAQEALRRQAVEAFLEDLAEITRERQIVILIDAYEKCGRELGEWIPEFVRDHVLDPERQLIVVIAGQKVPTQRLKLSLQERFDELVMTKDSLSEWDREHVAQFLKNNRVIHDDSDIDYLYGKIKQGWSIGRAVRTIRQYQREQAREVQNG